MGYEVEFNCFIVAYIGEDSYQENFVKIQFEWTKLIVFEVTNA